MLYAVILVYTTYGVLYMQYKMCLQLPSLSGHRCVSIGKSERSIGQLALIVNLLKDVIRKFRVCSVDV